MNLHLVWVRLFVYKTHADFQLVMNWLGEDQPYNDRDESSRLTQIFNEGTFLRH